MLPDEGLNVHRTFRNKWRKLGDVGEVRCGGVNIEKVISAEAYFHAFFSATDFLNQYFHWVFSVVVC